MLTTYFGTGELPPPLLHPTVGPVVEAAAITTIKIGSDHFS